MKALMSNNTIVAVDKFIQATRDSGYTSTASAVSELVDNSIEAGASQVQISVENGDETKQISISVHDNGCGMDPFSLGQALRFGGSSRFNGRGGLGRYGMGLPNSSMSQARRVSVFTWQPGSDPQRRPPSPVYSSSLDYDDIVSGRLTKVPSPTLVNDPPKNCTGQSGTLVKWSKCDRLDFKRVTTIERKLIKELGRRFRHFISKGIDIRVNGISVRLIDPLFLNNAAEYSGALRYGDDITYQVRADPEDERSPTGTIKVRFTELPIARWRDLNNNQKRTMGITKRAGVSIVRAGREVDFGWFFMGTKRRENYDDWWRCEVEFDPILDEAFGVTHTKQQVRPRSYLLDILTPDIEATARQLNSRVRNAHQESPVTLARKSAEVAASAGEQLLTPLTSTIDHDARLRMKNLSKEWLLNRQNSKALDYRIVSATGVDTSFFSYAMARNVLALVINEDHPFFLQLYGRQDDPTCSCKEQFGDLVEIMLLAAIRSEASETDRGKRQCIAQHRERWSDLLATFLRTK